MLYYAQEARKIALDSIKECMIKISLLSGNALSSEDAMQTTRFLSMLYDVIETEDKLAKGKAARMLRACGIFDENNNIVPAYQDIIVKKG